MNLQNEKNRNGAMSAEDEALRDVNKYEGREVDVNPGRYQAPPSVHRAHQQTYGNGGESLLSNRDIKTIEDLYAVYPSIGDGVFRIRVERTFPKSYNGINIAGFLCDIDEQISITSFGDRFGGGKYSVSVMGPIRNKVDQNGNPVVRRLASVDITIPGVPSLGAMPQMENDSMGTTQFRNSGLYSGESSDITLERMKMEERERSRLQAEKMKLEERLHQISRPPEQMFDAMNRQAERTVSEVKSLAEAQVMMLQRQNNALMAEQQQRNDEINKLRDALVQARSETVNASRVVETDQIVQLKQRYEQDISKLTTQHSQTIERLAMDYRNQLTEMTVRHADERQRIESQLAIERERIRDESSRREKQLTEDYDRRERALVQLYEGRLNDLQRTTEREVSNLRDQQIRELNSIKSSADTRCSVSEQMSIFRATSTEEQLNRLRLELDAQRRENEELRAKQNKDPIQLIRESHELASMTGMIRKEDSEAGGGEEAFDFKKEAAGVIKNLIDKAPEILDTISKRKEAAEQAKNEQVRMMQQQAAMQKRQQAERRMLPRTSMSMTTAPQMAPAASAPAMGMQRMSDAVAPPPDWALPAETMTMTSEPMSFEQAPPSPIQDVPPVAQQAPVQAEQRTEAPLVNVTPEQISQFIGELDNAIQGDVISPALFARGVLERIGKDNLGFLIEKLEPSSIVESIKAAGGESSAIVTRAGRKYIEQVWQEAKQLLS